MTSRLVLGALAGFIWVHGEAVEAQHLHVYGPAGTDHERRVIAVLEDERGVCVPADDRLVWSAAEVQVTVESRAGPCATWLRLRSEAGVDRARLTVRRDELRTELMVPMQETEHLTLRAVRRGRDLRVSTPDLGADERVSGFVLSAEGRVELEPRGGALRAQVPPDALLGVLVRTDTMVGVTAVRATGRRGSPQVLVLPADLAIEAGGPAREAAFIVAADRRGRLSRRLPLSVQSERGRLRSLR